MNERMNAQPYYHFLSLPIPSTSDWKQPNVTNRMTPRNEQQAILEWFIYLPNPNAIQMNIKRDWEANRKRGIKMEVETSKTMASARRSCSKMLKVQTSLICLQLTNQSSLIVHSDVHVHNNDHYNYHQQHHPFEVKIISNSSFFVSFVSLVSTKQLSIPLF